MISQRYLIDASVEDVWHALTSKKLIEQWSQAPAKMSSKEGSEFSLWGGDIYGTNTKVVKNHLLEQDWFANDWATPSKVAISLSDTPDGALVEVSHTDLPAAEVKEFEKGWQEFYFDPLATLVESL